MKKFVINLISVAKNSMDWENELIAIFIDYLGSTAHVIIYSI